MHSLFPECLIGLSQHNLKDQGCLSHAACSCFFHSNWTLQKQHQWLWAASRVKERNSHGGKRKSNATQSGRKATANGTWARRGEQWPGKCSYNFMSLHTSPFLHWVMAFKFVYIIMLFLNVQSYNCITLCQMLTYSWLSAWRPMLAKVDTYFNPNTHQQFPCTGTIIRSETNQTNFEHVQILDLAQMQPNVFPYSNWFRLGLGSRSEPSMDQT